MKWALDKSGTPLNGSTDGRWQLWRNVDQKMYPATPNTGFAGYIGHIASVERAPALGLLKEPACYSAQVIDPDKYARRNLAYTLNVAFRAAPNLFPTLKEAQLWCEREVRLMEIGELA